MTTGAAKKLLQQEQKARLERCQEELNALLKKYNCQLTAQAVITQDGRIAANVVLIDAQ